MKKRKILMPSLLILSLLSGFNANAQFGNLIQKAKEKAGTILEKAADKRSTAGKPKAVYNEINTDTDFSRGDSLIFSEDFSRYNTGSNVGTFKTNGAAIVARPAGGQGKWLSIQDNISYKLNRPASLPDHFTCEFDILAQAEQIKDIGPISFGFVKDNAVREHMDNSGAFVQLHYYDADAVNIGNYGLNQTAETRFDLSATANRILHVKLSVNGTQMAVYLDHTKLAETTLFQPKSARYFYFSGPFKSENGAKLFIGNFRIDGFRK